MIYLHTRLLAGSHYDSLAATVTLHSFPPPQSCSVIESRLLVVIEDMTGQSPAARHAASDAVFVVLNCDTRTSGRGQGRVSRELFHSWVEEKKIKIHIETHAHNACGSRKHFVYLCPCLFLSRARVCVLAACVYFEPTSSR